ncbi:YkoF family thiamine/hydroxymethylpyrimidine-binding protein [Idiomarina sp. HP20-50]|uniref:YkoF family thiamine/hydroxymethylpyrimidine-binding protein n=1 Tax=Idiomarina sp. HP20-50 TaxID=3070813 RepID=UPI00294B8172|nr:YkoF family thiamine/hydroxymethylpyrimidine-binding protein [Idiomarina sp. HP20-50]MDV6316754.1 YkoF family thiamine/hydroxymethylpyrimidine-binding protein [Idiomarina sp. HP20-50]
MQISVEMSLYPLADNYLSTIQDFIERLNQHSELTVITNTMSTQVFGEMQDVMRILGNEMERLYQDVPSNVLVCKFINKDLRPGDA